MSARDPMKPMPQFRRTDDRNMSETGPPLISKATAALDAGPRSDIRVELTLDEDDGPLRFVMDRETGRALFADLARIFASIQQDEADYWRRYFRAEDEQ